MFVGSLKNTQRAEALHPCFKRVFDYLKSHDLMSLPLGKVIIDGNRVWMNVDAVEGKDERDAKLEAHRDYIDIQLPLVEHETFGWSEYGSLTKMKETGYDKNRDIAFFDDMPDSYLTIAPGQFVIFFPEDAHAPCIGEGHMKKIVVKVKIDI